MSRVQLSAQFNVSQTPVREALLKLTEERLVDVFPQAATKVSLIDLEFARETHFLRRSIELEIVRELALKHSAELIHELEAIVGRHERMRNRHDLGGFTETDGEFHQCMYRASGKQALWSLVRQRSGHLDRLRRLHLPVDGKLDRILRDHRRILDAMAQGRPDDAQEYLRAHLSGTLESAEPIRAQHAEFFIRPE